MEKPVREYYPHPLKTSIKLMFAALFFLVMIILWLLIAKFDSVSYTLALKILDIIFKILFILFLVLTIASLLLEIKNKKIMPVIQIYSKKVILEYKTQGIKLELTKRDIYSITEENNGRFKEIIFKFNNLKQIAPKLLGKYKVGLFSKLLSYYMLKKNNVPIKYKQLTSGKREDLIYINYNLLKMQEKKVGGHIILNEIFYHKQYPSLAKDLKTFFAKK